MIRTAPVVQRMLAVAVPVAILVLVSLALITPARAALSFEDPQACLNGKLLMVEPTTAPIEVWLHVGKGIKLDLNVADCGGDPSLPIIPLSHILQLGNRNTVQILVHTKKWTNVQFHWNGTTYTRNSGNDPWILVTTRVN